MTISQMDWCLRMYDKHNPGILKLKTGASTAPLLAANRWTEVLEGKGLEEYYNSRLPAFKKGTVKI